MDKSFRDLIEIIHFTENVSTKIPGILDENEIYKVVIKEFAKSKRYTASILLLTEDKSALRIVETAMNRKKLRGGENLAGVRVKNYRVKLDRSSIHHQVIRKGKTIQVYVSDVIGELFPQPLAQLISKITGYDKKRTIITPLKRHRNIIGSLAVSSTHLAEHFIPSVKNLGQHISNALELADEISRRKQAEENLRESEFRYRTIFENAPTGIGLATLDGQVLEFNKTILKMTGYSKVEFKQINLKETYQNPEERKLLLKRLQRNGFVSNFEAKLKRKDGTPYYANLTITSLNWHGKNILLTIGEDVTERKKAEEELRKIHVDLKEKTKELTRLVDSQKEFIATVGHELRTPLSVIKAVVETELVGGRSSAKQLTLANKKTDQIKLILRNLMLVSRLEIGQEPIQKTRFKLKNLLREVLEDIIRETAGDLKPKIMLDCSEGIKFYGDQVKMSEVLINLLRNAIYHSSGQSYISLKAKKAKNSLQIFVEDKNSAIPEEDLEKIFEKFYRSKRAKKRINGLGLGLYICKKLTDAMGGKIWAESKKSGNKFVVQLPVSS